MDGQIDINRLHVIMRFHPNDVGWYQIVLHCTAELAPFLEESGGELYLNAMPAGFISLHADLLVHGSQPNHSPRRRCGTRPSSTACRAVGLYI